RSDRRHFLAEKYQPDQQREDDARLAQGCYDRDGRDRESPDHDPIGGERKRTAQKSGAPVLRHRSKERATSQKKDRGNSRKHVEYEEPDYVLMRVVRQAGAQSVAQGVRGDA